MAFFPHCSGSSGLAARRVFRAAGLAGAALAFGGCAVLGNVGQLEDDYYHIVRRASPDSLAAALPTQQLYVQQRADTLLLTPKAGPAPATTFRYRLRPTQRVLLQLNTNFNAAIYLGRRLDFYSVRLKRSTPFGNTPHVRDTGIGYGAFIGAGSTFVTPEVTNQHATTAFGYEGLVLHAGLAFIYDARAFNVGLATGLDQLMGPDGDYWVYHRKPWFGVLFGLDLN